MSPVHSGDDESPTSSSGSEYSSSESEPETTSSDADALDLESHLRLLETSHGTDEVSEIETAPLFTNAVRVRTQNTCTIGTFPFAQYGLLAGDVSRGPSSSNTLDPRIFYNIAAPSSAFICGSQGSGKSHTLSCMLEN